MDLFAWPWTPVDEPVEPPDDDEVAAALQMLNAQTVIGGDGDG